MTKTSRLSVNETCYGCSPLALQAMQKNFGNVHLYPELNPVALKEKIAVKFGVKSKNIVVGAGSVSIIDGLIQTFVGKDEEVLTFEKSFVAYGQFSQLHHHKCTFAALADFRCNPENLLPLINDKTRLIFIANPNNPTGTIISHHELENFLKKIPENIVVALDEAYAEYVTDASFPDAIALQKKYPNLVILRSFSKIYGLAGLRIGYGIMEEKLANSMIQGQIPFSLNCLSAGAAIAALEDENFILHSAKANAEQRDFLNHELKKLGYHIIPSQANFAYVWFEDDMEKKKVYDKLFANGILICDMQIYGQERSLRITIGNEDDCRRIVEFVSELNH